MYGRFTTQGDGEWEWEEVASLCAMNAHVWGVAPFILNPGVRCRWAVIFMSQPLDPQQRNTCTQWIGGWICLSAGLDMSRKFFFYWALFCTWEMTVGRLIWQICVLCKCHKYIHVLTSHEVVLVSCCSRCLKILPTSDWRKRPLGADLVHWLLTTRIHYNKCVLC